MIDRVADRPAAPYEPASPVTVQTASVFDPAPAPAPAPQAAPQLAPVASGVPEGFAPVPVTFSTASTQSPTYVDIVPASVEYVEAPASVEYISAEPVSAPVAESAEYVSIGALPDPDTPVPATAPGQLRPDLYGTALGDRPFVLPGAPGAF